MAYEVKFKQLIRILQQFVMQTYPKFIFCQDAGFNGSLLQVFDGFMTEYLVKN
jgi:hypothetical protein